MGIIATKVEKRGVDRVTMFENLRLIKKGGMVSPNGV